MVYIVPVTYFAALLGSKLHILLPFLNLFQCAFPKTKAIF